MSNQSNQELQNKVRSLEQINKKLLEEYEALNRNYEAIFNKLKEERNISKRLLDSVRFSQDKEKNEELIIQLNTYKEKYERLANSISDIESRLKSASNNNIKYQENEINYKKNIKLLEEKLRKNNENFQNSRKIDKKNEEKIGLYRQENQKLEEENNNLRKKNEEINKKIIETNKIYEQMKKENEIIYKLLEDSRKKIKDTEKALEFLKEKYKNSNNNYIKNNEIDKLKDLYNKALNEINSLKQENEILKSENEFYKGMNQPNKKDLNLNISNEFSFNLISNISNINPDLNKIIHIKKFFESKNEIINQYYSKIEEKMNILEDKFQNVKLKLSSDINELINKQKNSKNINDNEINNNLKSENLRLKLEISNLNSEIKKYEMKLNKKKSKKIKLLEEIKNLNIKINFYIEKEKNSVDLSEIKKQFKYINEIIQRLKLTMETFCINLKCKNCYKVKVKMFQLSCGHSICEDCIKTEKKCIECDTEFEAKNICENKFLSNTIARYNYAEQQINGDLGLVIETLQKYLK